MTSQGNNFYCIIKYFRNSQLNAWSEWKAQGCVQLPVMRISDTL